MDRARKPVTIRTKAGQKGANPYVGPARLRLLEVRRCRPFPACDRQHLYAALSHHPGRRHCRRWQLLRPAYREPVQGSRLPTLSRLRRFWRTDVAAVRLRPVFRTLRERLFGAPALANVQESRREFSPKEDLSSLGRFYDPFRPSIEPNGFATEQEMRKDVVYHLERVRTILPQTHVFVFTFGLTEAWVSIEDGAVYPTCPGQSREPSIPERYRFHNFTISEILADTEEFIAFARQINPTIRFLLTVSPVPLTATATGGHVLQASVYSKSVLRAACGDVYARHPYIDYFPSYELVASHPFRAMFFDPNLRTVTPKGVAHVMDVFFSVQPISKVAVEPAALDKGIAADSRDVVCDEEILRVFGP